MLLAIDVGNTAATYGIYLGGRLERPRSCSHKDIPKIIKNCSKSGGKNDFNVVISSVVPKVTQIIKKAVSRKKKAKTWIIGSNLPVKIQHRYRSIKKLGQDRIVNIYGATRIHGAPILVIDFGTAITFDYVSKRGVFEGGLIVPGPEISFQNLIEKAALLPKKIQLPKKSVSFLGRDTYSCLHSGILQGYGAMTDELVARFKRQFGNSLRVLATGGFALHLESYTRSFDILDPNHSIKSLILAYKDKNE